MAETKIDPRFVKWDATESAGFDPRFVKWDEPQSLAQQAGRIGGLAGRAAIRGVAGLPTLMAEGVYQPVKAIGGALGVPTVPGFEISPSAALDRVLTKAGLPEPQNVGERIGVNIGSALTGAGVTQTALNLMQPISRAGQGIREVMMTQPARQGVGATTGAGAASVTGELGGGPIAQTVAGFAGGMAPFAPQMMRGRPPPETTQRQEVLGQAVEAGYVFPPSQVNPSIANRLLGGFSGKAATEQGASQRNQTVTNNLARRAFGLPEDARLSEGTLEQVRTQAAAPYREIASISPSAANYLEQLRQARHDANADFKFYQRNADPAVLSRARQHAAEAERIETLFERFAASINRPQLIDELRAGRTRIAQTYEVERALNATTGDVDARILGQSLDRGAPMTGDLRTIARTQQAAPRSMIPEMNSQTPPGVSPLDYAAAGMMAAGSGNYGLLGSILGRPIVRAGILSRPYQGLMASPQLDPLNRANAANLGLLSGAYAPATGLFGGQ